MNSDDDIRYEPITPEITALEALLAALRTPDLPVIEL